MEQDKRPDDFSEVSFSDQPHTTRYRMWPYMLAPAIEVLVFRFVGQAAGLVGIAILTVAIFGAAWLLVRLLEQADRASDKRKHDSGES